jgi:hypothetical protein
VNRGGLYGFFVKGEGLRGTVGEVELVAPTGEIKTLESSTATSTESKSAKSAKADTSAEKSSKKKRKRQVEETHEGIRKRRKEEKAKTSSQKRKADEATDTDTEHSRVWKRIRRDVKNQIKRDEKAGRFLPLPSSKKATIRDPEHPGKTLTYKEAKARRDKAIREATEKLTKYKAVDAMMEGKLPNPNNYTREQALANFDRDHKSEKKEAKKSKDKQEPEAISESPPQPSDDFEAAVAAKIAKLSAAERSQYEERAKAKNQTLQQYVLRRIQKKSDKSERKKGADSSSSSTTGTPIPTAAEPQSKATKPKKVSSGKRKSISAIRVAPEVAVAA